MRVCFAFVISFCLFSCGSSNESEFSTGKAPNSNKHFSIENVADGIYLLSVSKPFVGAKLVEKYLLYPKGSVKPQRDDVTHYIPIPVERVAITSTTHLGLLEPLNQMGSIVAATNLSLFYSAEFQKQVNENLTTSIGRATINEEELISANVDVVFSYAIDASDLKKVEQLRKLGQKVILVSEYMEKKPLDKAAWISFMAAFFGKESQSLANTVYTEVSARYDSIEAIAQSVKKQPTVMLGFPWKGTWYVSGGNSFQATYLKSANVNYIWQDNKQEGSVPLTVETVFQDALEADYWLNCGSKNSLSQIRAVDNRFTAFKAYKNASVFNNYKRSNDLGANDYWESGVVRPDLILADLIQLMHPDLLKRHKLVYYNKLQ